MGDGPKVIEPDPPPVMPRDVTVSRDPGPRDPVQVQVSVDPGPRAPVDVRVSPDPGPRAPVDVRVTLDPGPRSTVDVGVAPDPGPRGPTDVWVTLDPPPRSPSDVVLSADPPPRSPVDVRISADPGPRGPVDVQVVLDPSPRSPTDVRIVPDPGPRPVSDVIVAVDPPPRGPTDVTVRLSPPPRIPTDLGLAPDPAARGPLDVTLRPDPAPAILADVRVVPSSGPRPPTDVPVSLDPAPRPPVDVRVTPVPGPRGPTDVPVVTDPPPRAPSDVKVTPDPGPRAPVDVPTSPDPPPRAPLNVATVPDPAPRPPVDVVTSNDPPPRVPTQVQTNPDPPPALPFNPPTVTDPPPRAPFNVTTPPDPPPRLPVDPATIPSDPGKPKLPDPPVVRGGTGRSPTAQEIIATVSRYDPELGRFIDSLTNIETFGSNGPGGGALNPAALAAWFKNYLNSVGVGGIAQFLAEQAVLYGMNPTVARVFNPAYFALMAIPGSMGHVHTTVDTQAGLTMATVALVQDTAIRLRALASHGNPAGDQDVYGPGRTPVGYGNVSDIGQDFTVDEMVAAAVDNTSHPFLTFDDKTGVKRFDAAKYFDNRDSFGAVTAGRARRRQFLVDVQNGESAKLAASAFIEGVIPVRFRGENPDGAIYTPTPDPSGIGNIEDDDARVPLSFTDLRRDPSKRAYRSVYFRPLNLGFTTAFAAEYQEGSAFGRTDPIVSYMRTVRTVSLNFEVHAFSPEDVQTMYNKLTWLESMCYPSYTVDSLFKSGPVIRLRIGDAVGSSAGGLGGVIRNLSIDFAEALWEIKRGMKVPRSFKVTVDFLALHDGPVGLVGGQFGVFQLPPVGNAPDKDTNNPGGPTDSRAGAVPTGPTLIKGGFARFGEPVKRD